MKNLLTILCAAVLVIAAMAPASAQTTGNNGVGIFVNTGFGWANNLRQEDFLNNWANIVRANPGFVGFSSTPQKEESGSSLIYGGFDLEPRFYSGNIVYAGSIGYHSTTTGQRDLNGTVAGQPKTYRAEIQLTMISLRASAYYKVNLSDTSYLLLGGGFGYYHGTLEIGLGFTDNMKKYDGSAWTIGWHTGLEYNRQLGPVLLSLGVMSRFAEIWNMEVNGENGDELFDASSNLTGIYFYVGAGYMI